MANYRTEYKMHYEIDFDGDVFVIHHIDGDRCNNAIENLILLPHDVHTRYHRAKQDYEYACVSPFDTSLSFDGMCTRDMQFWYLRQLQSVLDEAKPWIELKTKADAIGWKAYSIVPGIRRL